MTAGTCSASGRSARQKELGVIPADAELTTRHDEIPAWDEMPDELKPVLAREMEVYAGFLEHVDHHVGRLIDTIEDLGVLDNTIIYYIVGDNGASAEGTAERRLQRDGELQRDGCVGDAGVHAEQDGGVRLAELLQPLLRSAGRGRWTRRSSGPSRSPRIGVAPATAPSCIGRTGSSSRVVCASQFTHVIDVAPTILEAAGLPEPTMVNGVQQSPMEGTSMLYSFNEADAPERHDLQYFEMFANRGIYHKGWSAVTKHRTPWVMVGGKLPAFDEDVWELYDGSSDYSQARNLVAEQPDRLAKLQRLWLIEATKYNVLPMDDRTSERLVPEMAGRPTLIRGDSQLFFPGMGRLSENSVVSIKNKSFSVTAEVDGTRRRRRGRDHRPRRPVRRVVGLYQERQRQVRLQRARHPGVHYRVRRGHSGRHASGARWSSPTTAAGWPRAATSPCTSTATPVGTGRVGATQPMIFSADETTDIGYESGTTVTSDYTARGSRFTGKINWVQIDLGKDDHDHFIDPDERLRIAMARQ